MDWTLQLWDEAQKANTARVWWGVIWFDGVCGAQKNNPKKTINNNKNKKRNQKSLWAEKQIKTTTTDFFFVGFTFNRLLFFSPLPQKLQYTFHLFTCYYSLSNHLKKKIKKKKREKYLSICTVKKFPFHITEKKKTSKTIYEKKASLCCICTRKALKTAKFHVYVFAGGFFPSCPALTSTCSAGDGGGVKDGRRVDGRFSARGSGGIGGAATPPPAGGRRRCGRVALKG